jgi:hypothetical protein
MADARIVAHALIDARGLAGVVTLRYADASSSRPWWIGTFKVYQNHINLINDAECDTLTGLFNRKTFDARIHRVLAMQREACENPVYAAPSGARPGPASTTAGGRRYRPLQAHQRPVRPPVRR